MVNNLTAVAMTTGEVRLQSDGSPWRPLVHVEDISRAFLAMLEAPRELVHDEAFNVGRDEDNVQIRDIAEMVRDAVPGSPVTFAEGAGPDLRDYRVDFAKLQRHFPDLKMRWTVRDGIDELAGRLRRVRADLRGLRVLALRAAAADPRAARRRPGRRDAAPPDGRAFRLTARSRMVPPGPSAAGPSAG